MPSLHGKLRDFLGVGAGYVPTPKPPRARAEAASQSPPPTLRDEQRPTAKPAEQPASASPRRRPVRRSQSLARLRAARAEGRDFPPQLVFCAPGVRAKMLAAAYIWGKAWN